MHRYRILKQRAETIASVRRFFSKKCFLEVETPALVAAPNPERHIQPIHVRKNGDSASDSYLISSPEPHMKRLLSGGFERIFQICRCFRQGEFTPSHNPEFTMLEWYRAGETHRELATDTEELIRSVAADVLHSDSLTFNGNRVELDPPWPRMTVAEAFSRHAGLKIDFSWSEEEFARAAAASGFTSTHPGDSWDDLFAKLLIERVEPALAREPKPVFLTDYPSRLSPMARQKENDPHTASRIELYIAGLELANGFSEQNDPRRQRRILMAERRHRPCMQRYPLDEAFLDSLHHMPEAAGMALGIDRLVMLTTASQTIQEAVAFPWKVVGHGQYPDPL